MRRQGPGRSGPSMRRVALGLACLLLFGPLVAQEKPSRTALSTQDRETLKTCVTVPIYVPAYLPAGLTRSELEASYNSYTLAYSTPDCVLSISGTKRQLPPDLNFKTPLEGEVQMKVGHPELGMGKLCWLPRKVDALTTREEYAAGVFGKGTIAYDVVSTGELSPKEVQKFMKSLTLLKL